MSPILYQTTDWDSVDASMHAGETGTAYWRTVQYDGLRIRKVEYSENYKANHWCTRGHIVYCIEGELISELSDGRTFVLSAGMSYQVTDGVSAHRSFSRKGATLLIIDGDFLKNNKEMAGTVALKFVEPGVYEFTKMAVEEKFRGKKIGLALANAAIEKARHLGAVKIILYSNTLLEPAIALYRKIGFREIPVDGPYKRSNIKMELKL